MISVPKKMIYEDNSEPSEKKLRELSLHLDNVYNFSIALMSSTQEMVNITHGEIPNKEVLQKIKGK